jgi:hypothetical protein
LGGGAPGLSPAPPTLGGTRTDVAGSEAVVMSQTGGDWRIQPEAPDDSRWVRSQVPSAVLGPTLGTRRREFKVPIPKWGIQPPPQTSAQVRPCSWRPESSPSTRLAMWGHGPRERCGDMWVPPRAPRLAGHIREMTAGAANVRQARSALSPGLGQHIQPRPTTAVAWCAPGTNSPAALRGQGLAASVIQWVLRDPGGALPCLRPRSGGRPLRPPEGVGPRLTPQPPVASAALASMVPLACSAKRDGCQTYTHGPGSWLYLVVDEEGPTTGG